ncbi:hypothetical protein [Mucilaginibacter xinganensis]|uniref:Alpha-L-arabinofuranosidase n=1 Tax=Mucilaginibacter xinganensis TaxID=1234841 RepID=A0A223NTE4_9SPHI|nr:hypothetical protein [Mucilaginibacter xinganensis]ASU33165.1 alpha-L-arabinofuranosidase [Mucilaginibacter xinganensis]
MSKKIKIIGFIVAAQLTFTIYSCTKTTTVLEDNSPAITTPVSFSKDIQPILTSSCAISGCHSGPVAPNLSAATAYTVLTGGSLINTSTPEKSDVYLWITGKKAVSMPLGSANNPSNLNAKMLAWIKQGAKNN